MNHKDLVVPMVTGEILWNMDRLWVNFKTSTPGGEVPVIFQDPATWLSITVANGSNAKTRPNFS